MTKLVNTGSSGANTNRVIHTQSDCMFVSENSLPVDEAPVDADELDECVWCSKRTKRNQNQHRECPFCERMVPKLPKHLPCEESP